MFLVQVIVYLPNSAFITIIIIIPCLQTKIKSKKKKKKKVILT